jgi:hypothetical protein
VELPDIAPEAEAVKPGPRELNERIRALEAENAHLLGLLAQAYESQAQTLEQRPWWRRMLGRKRRRSGTMESR